MMQTNIGASWHEIGEFDVLCGKDKSLSTHPGNRLFRELIEEAKVPYDKAHDKATKMKITKNIVDRLQNEHGCRFVKFNTDSAAWVELSRVESRDKVGHALRFAIKGSKKTQLTRRCRRSSATKRPKKIKSNEEPTIRSMTSVVSAISLTSRCPSINFRSSSTKISDARLQRARENLDLIFKRQQQLLHALNTDIKNPEVHRTGDCSDSCSDFPSPDDEQA